MDRRRLALIGLVVAAALFLGGLLLGGSGRTEAETARDQAELQLNLERARVSILQGRMALVGLNFGEASQQFDASRAPLQAARDRLNAVGRTEEAGRVSAALNSVVQAQELTLAVDRSADAKAVEALGAIQGIQ